MASIIEFVDILELNISPAQRTLLKSIYGLPLDDEELELWRQCTGRQTYPQKRFSEVTVIAGARAGKDSRIAAPIACYEALFGGHEQRLARGERGVIPIVAQDARASRIAFGFVRDYLTKSALLGDLGINEKSAEIELPNGLSIVCFPCTVAALRGWSIPVAIMDEVAFFRLEGRADSDANVEMSIRRGGISFAQSTLVKISTPYFKGGILYEDFKRAWGQDDPDLLVWKASSMLMNPSLKSDRLALERRRLDPSRYLREYEAEFVDDLTAFLQTEWIDAAVQSGRYELPPQPSFHYVGACDPSGGGANHFTFCLMHREGDQIVQDVMKGSHRRGKQAPDLASIVREIADVLKRYHTTAITGDGYAAQWVIQEFARNGVAYQNAADLKLDRSRCYLEAEPLFAQGRLALLDHPQQIREFQILEKRAKPGGGASVDIPKGAGDHGSHGDYANAAALAAALLAKRAQPVDLSNFDISRGSVLRTEPSPWATIGQSEAVGRRLRRQLEAEVREVRRLTNGALHREIDVAKQRHIRAGQRGRGVYETDRERLLLIEWQRRHSLPRKKIGRPPEPTSPAALDLAAKAQEMCRIAWDAKRAARRRASAPFFEQLSSLTKMSSARIAAHCLDERGGWRLNLSPSAAVTLICAKRLGVGINAFKRACREFKTKDEKSN